MNKLDGHVQSLDRRGNLASAAHYVAGVLHGEVVQYGPGGQVLRRMSYREGKLEGAAELFDASGALVQRLHHRAGLLDGECTIFARGRVRMRQTFVGGLLHGPFTIYSELGLPLIHGQNRRGRFHGEQVAYRPEGARLRVSQYMDGLLSGEVVEFHPDGKSVRERATYRRGLLHGVRTTLDPVGRVTKRERFTDGKPAERAATSDDSGPLRRAADNLMRRGGK